MRIHSIKKAEDAGKDMILPTSEKSSTNKRKKPKDITESITEEIINVDPPIIPCIDVGPIIIEKTINKSKKINRD